MLNGWQNCHEQHFSGQCLFIRENIILERKIFNNYYREQELKRLKERNMFSDYTQQPGVMYSVNDYI
jgi:hypothetical protein